MDEPIGQQRLSMSDVLAAKRQEWITTAHRYKDSGMSIEQIATAMKMPESTVRVMLERDVSE